MDILVISSKKFYSYLLVMLASLYENHVGTEINVYVMHSELEAEDFTLLQEQADFYNNHIHPIPIDTSLLAGFPVRQQFPGILYFRMFIADVLPQSVNRVLALDVDIIVRKSLQEFYDTDLDNYYIAACEDLELNTDRFKRKLQIPQGSIYFNAGIMLFNLHKMREEGVGFKYFLQIAGENISRLTWFDQDIFNLALSSKCRIVNATDYNCPPALFEQLYGSAKSHEEHFASIIHYLSPNYKPWNATVASPGSIIENLWWDYAQKTPFYEQLRAEYEESSSNLGQQNRALKLYYAMALLLLKTEDRQRKLEHYFQERNFYKIAVYGVNPMQEILCSDLDKGEVKVSYLIDKNAKGYSNGIEIRNGSHFDDVDVIIVAACAHFRQIRDYLDDSCPVLSLETVIYELNKM
ncbi:hypothetical protein B1748_18505 [Paenibacillus sp. MY03]|uniref:glycosyltransferase family 8 protein n=1 Tax=Paenibacillus sp. MY03 TaxID=302980 RepID=UPI000B3CF515|nr:glycosyltransferase family 8 protein [Paenibacillus sp. MY03]OUS75131.1 hypothetical protein B1748_18505 [Paenibacillus sp. MY03]